MDSDKYDLDDATEDVDCYGSVEPRKLSIRRALSKDELLYNILNKEWPQTPVNKRVQEIGFEFFEEFAKALRSYNHFKESCFGQVKLLRREAMTVDPSQLGFNPKDMDLDAEELERLYAEALYTIKHKIGKTSGSHVEETKDLERYVQAAFNLTEEEHQKLLRRSVEAKPPVVVLEVTVAEARKLEAKDADGFSDPYCMLGIVPISMLKPFAQRFAMFEGKIATATDVIPAKFIKSTSVKFNTLQPIWNEKFRFDLEDAATDKLHLDVWDRDDDFSVIDSVRKLNEIKGMKGLGRYFKQIAQSARAHNLDSVDDFMGTLEIPLADIPSTGLNQWFDLSGRSNKSKVEGQIRLELNLATKEDKGIYEGYELVEMKEHKNLMRVFIEHEYNLAKEGGQVWSGELSREAKTILHQHAIQGDITLVRQAICWWLAMTHQFCRKMFPWQHLIQSLEDMEGKWDSEILYREDEEILGESMDQCCKFLLKLIDHKIEITTDVAVDVDGIKDALSCLVKIHGSKVFQRCLPFHTSLRSDLTNLIKQIYASSYEHFWKTKNISAEDQDLIKRYTQIITSVVFTLIVGKEAYNSIFESAANVNFFKFAYKETHSLLSANLITDLEELLRLHQQDWEKTEYSGENYDSCMPVFQLFLVVRRFYSLARHLSPSDISKLMPVNYNECFKAYVNQWISIVDILLTKRLQFIHQLDQVESVEGDVAQSSLPTDVAYCFGQVVNFWFNLRWSDDATSVPQHSFTYRFVKILSEGAQEVMDMMNEKLKKMGYYDEIGQFDISKELCITINNMERIRTAYLSAAQSLNRPGGNRIRSGESVDETFADQRQSIVEELINTTDGNLTKHIKMVTDKVADKMRPDLKKFVFKLCWTPEAASHQDSIANLMNYLDKNLETVNEYLLRTNFDKILHSIWIEVLEEIDSVVSVEELSEAVWIPGRLHQSMKDLLEFFHAGGKGLELELLKCPLYENLLYKLKSMLMSNEELILAFHDLKLNLQENWNHAKYGCLVLRAYYNSGNIFVEVLGAKNLMPMDANGLSDPYVTVNVCPEFLFNIKPQQTSVVKKTLNPVFNESFTFEVPHNMCSMKGASLVFVVMDHDFLNPNDFSGEAYVPLTSLPGVSKHNTLASGLTPITVPLMQATETEDLRLRTLLKALRMRKSDPTVNEFLRRNADTIPRPD